VLIPWEITKSNSSRSELQSAPSGSFRLSARALVRAHLEGREQVCGLATSKGISDNRGLASTGIKWLANHRTSG
jgi:hypothetical protein